METNLQNFIYDRPSIDRSAFARELNFDRDHFEKILKGQKKIPKMRRGDFLAAMKKYGWVPPETAQLLL